MEHSNSSSSKVTIDKNNRPKVSKPWKPLNLDQEAAERGGFLKGIMESNYVPKVKRMDSLATAPAKDRDSMVVPKPEVKIIDDTDAVAIMLDGILACAETLLGVDLEGIELGRDGTISIVSIYSPGTKSIYLVDVVTLGSAAFTTPAVNIVIPTTLKDVLESKLIKKLLFDCRSDNDALANLYDVNMDGVIDLQLMDLACRNQQKERIKVFSLSHVLQQRVKISNSDQKEWRNAKDWGTLIFSRGKDEVENMFEDCDGIWTERDVEAFEKPLDEQKTRQEYQAEWLEGRPLHQIIVNYCVGDVVLLPAMYETFVRNPLWTDDWAKRVDQETERRLKYSKDKDFVKPTKEIMSRAPEGWDKVEQRATRGRQPSYVVEEELL